MKSSKFWLTKAQDAFRAQAVLVACDGDPKRLHGRLYRYAHRRGWRYGFRKVSGGVKITFRGEK